MTSVGVPYNHPDYQKLWRELHRERLASERKKKYWTTGKARHQRRLYWLYKYKIAKGCRICGYNLHASALDFDHINPVTKSFEIAKRVPNTTLKTLFNEIKKCQILCANCHRIKTYEERIDNIPKTA